MVKSQKLSGNKKVIIRFKVNEDEKPVAIEMIRSVNPKIDKEAERLLLLIPGWDVFYRRGKVVETQWTLPIFFDKEFYEKQLE